MGCTDKENNGHDENNSDENSTENSTIYDLDLIITANQNNYRLNATENITANITLVNVNNSSVFIEEWFFFGSTLYYEINGVSNKYFEEYEGVRYDYLPKKEILQPDGKKFIQFILINEIKFEKIYGVVGTEIYGKYNFTVRYSSVFTKGIVQSNNFQFDILE